MEDWINADAGLLGNATVYDKPYHNLTYITGGKISKREKIANDPVYVSIVLHAVPIVLVATNASQCFRLIDHRYHLMTGR